MQENYLDSRKRKIKAKGIAGSKNKRNSKPLTKNGLVYKSDSLNPDYTSGMRINNRVGTPR